MRLNENIDDATSRALRAAISTPEVLLVPYDAHHVLRYHEWMQDPAVREATASEQLTLEEEYENQRSWRTSHDKLTFIVCRPCDATAAVATGGSEGGVGGAVYAGAADAPPRMLGDVNLFLAPWDGGDGDEGEGGEEDVRLGGEAEARPCAGEVDIMIAERADRGRGAGKAAVAALLAFVRRNLDGILGEYAGAHRPGGGQGGALKELVAKIKAGNAGSIALFGGLGFRQRGQVNYFGEVQMVLGGVGEGGGEVEGYRECVYDRSRLG